MQELNFQDLQGEPVLKKFDIPPQTTGIAIRVNDGKEGVVLTVDHKEVVLTVPGARDLALALRQSANRVEKLSKKR
jgi:hypothetical protein